MANNKNKVIKGITVEIDGNTTKLGEALNEVDGQLKNTQSELRKVDRALKSVDPGNTVLLEQKQELLNDAIVTTKKKLEELEDAQDEVTQKYKTGEIDAGAYREFQRTIEITKGNLHELERKAEDVRTAQRKMASSGADYAAEKIDNLGGKADESRQDFDKFNNELNDTDTEARNASGGIDALNVAVGNLAAQGVTAIASTVKNTVIDTTTASNNFAALTGVNAEDMPEYENIIDNLYSSGMGEDKNDIASALALVKQSLGDLDSENLQEITENALFLRDTFDYDVGESLRAVKMLTDQFGVSSAEAFELVVQGTQQGLNKNGDLLDTINEYSVHYKQLGFDADEMMNSLANGADSGTFSVDKLGDAMKEFGIRAKDSSKTTTEGFTLIGLDADKMREKFAAGGEIAKDATQEVINKLFALDDKVLQNQAGVDLFGTMWEDLSEKGVRALTDTQGEIDKTADKLESAKDIKYDDIGTELTVLGRTAQEEIIEPLIEDFLPDIKDGIEWLSDNVDDLKPVIQGVGVVLGTTFAVNKISGFVSNVGSMFSAFKNVGTAIKGCTTQQLLLNAAQYASPIGLILAGVAGIAGAMYLWNSRQEELNKNTPEFTANMQSRIDKINEEYDAWNNTKDARDELVANNESEFAYYQNLKTELDNIVTSSGNVKSGYEDRAKFITNELEELTGLEIKYNDGVIENYQTLSDEIDNVIRKKRAESMLGAYEESYQNAIKNTQGSNSYYMQMLDIQSQIDEKEKYLKEHWTDDSYNPFSEDAAEKAQIKNDIASLTETYNQLEQMYYDSLAVIDNYEGLQTALLTENEASIADYQNRLTNNFQTALTGTEETLKQQYENYKTTFENLRTAYNNNVPGITEEMVIQAKEMVLRARFELAALPAAAEEKAKDTADRFAEGIMNGEITGEEINEHLSSLIEDGTSGTSGMMYRKGYESGQNYAIGMSDGISDTPNPVNSVFGVASSVNNTVENVWDEHSPSRVAEKYGRFYIKGLGNGAINEKKSLLDTFTGISTEVNNAIQEQLITIPIADLNARYTTAISDGKINPSLSRTHNFTFSIGQFINNTDNDIDSLVNKISNKLNIALQTDERALGW